MPPDPLRMAVLSEPAMATMNTSHIVKDEVMGGDLHGYHDHFSGACDPQWPQTGGLGPGAYHRGCHEPCVVSKLMTTFGQRSELMTAFEQGRELITAFGQRG